MESTASLSLYIESLKDHLKTLAKQTSQTVEEALQVAWDVALAWGHDIANADNREPFLKKVKKALFRERDESRRFARLDRPVMEDEPGMTLLDFVAAPEESDPLKKLLAEEPRNGMEWLRTSYSQFSAYSAFILNSRSGEVAAKYLAIPIRTLAKRVSRALEHMHRQPSLFDGLLHLGNFLPQRGTPVSATSAAEIPTVRGQLRFRFVT